MIWYLIELHRGDIENGKDKTLEQRAQAVWDSIGNKPDFALFGVHKVGDPDSPNLLYYLFDGRSYCPEGSLMWMKPRQIDKPLREGLRVIVGDPEAIQLLD